jgi:hypothetical protein
MAAAVSGNVFGSIKLACSGQTIRTIGGLALGSSSSMLMVSWLIWAEARGVMGDDWDTVPPVGIEAPEPVVNTPTGAAY